MLQAVGGLLLNRHVIFRLTSSGMWGRTSSECGGEADFVSDLEKDSRWLQLGCRSSGPRKVIYCSDHIYE